MCKLKKTMARMLVMTTCVVSPAMLFAGSYGDSAVRDGAVTVPQRAQATVPCARLGRNIPASLAAEMDCGSATPRVAGERVRNTGGGLFGGHRIGAGPAANNDDDGTRVSDRRSTDDEDDTIDADDGPSNDGDGPNSDGDGPNSDGDGPNNDGDGPNKDGDTPSDGNGSKTKAERLSELGLKPSDVRNQSQGFRDSFNDYVRNNGSNADWSDFNPSE